MATVCVYKWMYLYQSSTVASNREQNTGLHMSARATWNQLALLQRIFW